MVGFLNSWLSLASLRAEVNYYTSLYFLRNSLTDYAIDRTTMCLLFNLLVHHSFVVATGQI